LVGAIVALHLLRVQPAAAFNINWTAYLVFITVIGGVGTIEGPIIGTVIYYVLRETTAKYGEWYFIVLGLVAIVVTVWSPRGIYGYIAQKTNFYLFPLQRKLAFSDGDRATGTSAPGRGWGRGRSRNTGETVDPEGSGQGPGLTAAVNDPAAG
jgi:branched-chain amino acid transport system permease protein